MDFKKTLYESYQTTHSVLLYGTITLEQIERNFSSWKYYYQPHFPVDKNASMLDIGCGIGSFVYYLQRLGYTNVQGIDVSSQQIEAGLKLGIQGLKVHDLNEFLTTTQEQFDFIIARDVIEHFTRQEAFDIITKISKVLKPGGKFLMQVPNGQGIYYTSIFYGDYTHEMAYTESSAKQLILNCGFRKVTSYPTGPVPHTFISRFRSWLWWCKVKQIQFWKMIETGSARGIFTSNLIVVSEK
jgi:2-polyprenyl-3-methyl-5-hydroxy-6-metoxy-1,4-benzoquinol methylase